MYLVKGYFPVNYYFYFSASFIQIYFRSFFIYVHSILAFFAL